MEGSASELDNGSKTKVPSKEMGDLTSQRDKTRALGKVFNTKKGEIPNPEAAANKGGRTRVCGAEMTSVPGEGAIIGRRRVDSVSREYVVSVGIGDLITPIGNCILVKVTEGRNKCCKMPKNRKREDGDLKERGNSSKWKQVVGNPGGEV